MMYFCGHSILCFSEFYRLRNLNWAAYWKWTSLLVYGAVLSPFSSCFCHPMPTPTPRMPASHRQQVVCLCESVSTTIMSLWAYRAVSVLCLFLKRNMLSFERPLQEGILFSSIKGFGFFYQCEKKKIIKLQKHKWKFRKTRNAVF